MNVFHVWEESELQQHSGAVRAPEMMLSMKTWHRPMWHLYSSCAMQAPDSGTSLPQPLGPRCIPSPVICHLRGLHLKCKRPGGADCSNVQMAIRGLTLGVLDDAIM